MLRAPKLPLYAAIVAAALLLTTPAHAYPSSWIAQARCIHAYETGQWWQGNTLVPLPVTWRRLWNDRRNGSSRGGMQFLYSTWQNLVARHHLRGYPSDPADASKAQQVYAAWLLWKDDAGSWHEWSTARGCGLR